ncbi:hypothetical protein [Pseudoalteromonas luteoviolacea]|uniref:hypothetical protein n=1 Tax=Pseudoalteromonas luteoviolacea TaxID=43657 RepID=UPI00114DB602|nr:hypothetical protein [Pseudoalteromonas luteoviolacea]TQF71340.1 hypothetical protein FLM44_09690 [Pseudoalteromonas luteoviolacea]
MNSISKLAIVSLGMLSASAFAAGDNKINCKTETSQIKYYYGWASCHASGKYLQEYVSRSSSLWHTIEETEFDGINWSTYRCTTTLPQTGYDTHNSESCQYTPKANITEHLVQSHYDRRTDTTYYEAGVIVADFTYSDRDGQVQKVEKWVNGVSTTRGHVDITSTSTVRLRVTDNDGNVTDTTRTLTPPMIEQCRRRGMLVLCGDDFF